MSASQTFLEDLMQFFADRCGGMAVMILAGSGKVLLYVHRYRRGVLNLTCSRSQGTCDVAGKPKILYGDIESERAVLEVLAGRINTQACLVTGKSNVAILKAVTEQL